MALPTSMTLHTLDARKGWPRPNAVDYDAKFNTTDLATLGTAYAGRCVHVHSDGTFKYGVSGAQMPLFLFVSSNDADVSNPGGTVTTDAGAWVPIAPIGKMMALVAIGAYELETTEFVGDVDDYVPNDVLKSATGTGSDAGKLDRSATKYTDSIVGVVSRPGYTNSHGKSAIAFWPVYLPTTS